MELIGIEQICFGPRHDAIAISIACKRARFDAVNSDVFGNAFFTNGIFPVWLLRRFCTFLIVGFKDNVRPLLVHALNEHECQSLKKHRQCLK